MSLSKGAHWFREFVLFEFDRITRRIDYRSKSSTGVGLEIYNDDYFTFLRFSGNDVSQVAEVPMPRTNEVGNTVIGRDVLRAVGTWHMKDKEVSFWQLMKTILIDRIEDLFPQYPGVGKRSQIEKIIRSFSFGRAPLIVKNFQRIVNDIINKLPICGTDMQVWAMNNRVMFVEPAFNTLPPQDALEYLHEKNKKFFPWTSIGLSDSAMVKDYLLKVDLRKFTPFGVKHHNPMRNLYQTLGMVGEEQPLVKTESSSKLESLGVRRTGYNWMTVFLDLPLNFEDQLIVSARHQDKVNSSTRTYLSFGKVLVNEGEELGFGSILSHEPGNKLLTFTVHADSAKVTSIEEVSVVLGGVPTKAYRTTVQLNRRFKDGFKFTNLHGNKGIAVFCETGMMFDPIRHRYVDIDIIVSAKTVGNRRNFGQIFEAFTTLLSGPDKTTVIPDDYFCNVTSVKKALVKAGAREDGTCEVETKWGKFKAVCGWVFWGLIKEPEDAIWEKKDVVRTNQVGLRPAGNKISHIELKALTTMLGPGSSVVKEVLSHQEGADIVAEYIKVLKSVRGEVVSPNTVKWESIKPILQTAGFLHNKEELSDTISDESLMKDGFMLSLPVDYRTFVPKNESEEVEEGLFVDEIAAGTMFSTNKLYVPFVELREPWQHQSGKWGISDLAAAVNNILIAITTGDKVDISRTIRNYIKLASDKLSSKTGLVSTYCMAVRYPHSAKATAMVSDSLPENTIEIHSSMALDLGVSTGDYVLVERFPCLGFMSVRVQKVQVTDNPASRFVIRVSGSSLASQALDFDGDTLYVLSFKNRASNEELEYHFRFPNETIAKFIKESSDKKKPCVRELNLDDYCGLSLKNGQPPMSFAELTRDVQAEIAKTLIGIKMNTGSVVALGYNMMRIIEKNVGYEDVETSAEAEVILDSISNSVFGSKHKVVKLLESLAQEGVVDA